MGVRMHRIGYISKQGRAIKNDLIINNKIVMDILNFKRYLQDKYNNSVFKIAEFEEETLNKFKYNTNCGAGYNIIKISADGYIHPCPIMNLPIKHIKNITIKEYAKQYSC